MRSIKPSTERIYVKVNSDFDNTGHMQPRSITWADGRTFRIDAVRDDGRTFPIDAVRDYRPAEMANGSGAGKGDCYIVLIRGQEKHLFFERTDPRFSDRIGRWFVEKATAATS